MDITGISFVDDLKLKGKKVFIRVDFNVPLNGSEITDDARIRAAIPTIEYVVEQGGVPIIASHLGRPKGAPNPKYSMEPVALRLAKLTGYEVILPESLHDPVIPTLIADIKPDQVVLLENLRFHPGEEKGDAEFAKFLADLADIYISDAFGAMHRKHASVYQMVQHFGRGTKAAGLLVRDEIRALGGLLGQPAKPFVAVMGGAKVSDKIGVLTSLIEKVDKVVIGGAMAYTFLAAQGHNMGASRVEEDQIDTALKILQRAAKLGKEIVLPVDHRIARSFDAKREEDVQVTSDIAISEGWMGLDIGPKSVELFVSEIAEAKTIFWNGPMGVFESELFSKGTMAVAHAIADAKGFTVIGGGDSASAAKVAGVEKKVDHISTGGGASLELIENGTLPGIEALRLNHPFS